jgi:hypothetical protein
VYPFVLRIVGSTFYIVIVISTFRTVSPIMKMGIYHVSKEHRLARDFLS